MQLERTQFGRTSLDIVAMVMLLLNLSLSALIQCGRERRSGSTRADSFSRPLGMPGAERIASSCEFFETYTYFICGPLDRKKGRSDIEHTTRLSMRGQEVSDAYPMSTRTDRRPSRKAAAAQVDQSPSTPNKMQVLQSTCHENIDMFQNSS